MTQDFPTLAAQWARDGIEAPPLLGASEHALGPNVSTLELMTTQGTVVCIRHTPPGTDHEAGVLLGTEVTAGVVALAGQRSGTELIARLAGVPVLVIHGLADSIIPAASARLVHAEAAEPKHIWYIPDGDHVLAGHVDELEERIGKFVRSLDSRT